MPEKQERTEPLDDATLKNVVGGATKGDIEQNCPPPPPPPPAPAPEPEPASTSSGGTSGGGSGGVPRR